MKMSSKVTQENSTEGADQQKLLSVKKGEKLENADETILSTMDTPSSSKECNEQKAEGSKKGSNKKTETYTMFYGNKSPFSQHHPAKFVVDGITYSCAEQYMMHQKAVTFKDDQMAKEIMKTSCPKQMKKFGRKVKNFDKDIWKEKSKKVVRRASMAKYTQNPSLKAQLLETAGTVLVECSPRDRLWGIGLGASNPKAKNKANWRGKNLLGYILTEVRDTIKEEENNKVTG